MVAVPTGISGVSMIPSRLASIQTVPAMDTVVALGGTVTPMPKSASLTAVLSVAKTRSSVEGVVGVIPAGRLTLTIQGAPPLAFSP